ncbi:hypothetical protein MHC_05790 [Mycoplasma haemocanis str. Illinois]|uniref:Uncharacterized protein n=1 Tax=Mycoplasma haemocanis (strain Illinois) TaxID=1111676 RepID=H6N8N9_MYCHN|nr:hypothetical protein [Mycoplasma haemocanis]AEW46011.2 hypothetical protein MHC_05790 [Mycoplasma haemocanis str. Illinois]
MLETGFLAQNKLANNFLKRKLSKKDRSTFISLNKGGCLEILDYLITHEKDFSKKEELLKIKERDNYFFDSKLLLLTIEIILGI